MHSIALANFYFGELPDWVDNYVETCKHNPTISWFLFGDGSAPRNAAPNFHFLPMSRTAFRELARERLGVSANIDHAYKLCDFKPTFGELLAERLSGFDFWGHCDLDIVWGALRSFFVPELLNAYDVISTNPGGTSGPLTIYRNRPAINALYRRGAYEQILSDPANHIFDEQGFDTVVKQAQQAGELRLHCAALHEYDGYHAEAGSGETACVWRDGRLTCSVEQRELMYYHFAATKRWSWPDIWQADDPSPTADRGSGAGA